MLFRSVVTLFNKQDLVEERQVLKDLKAQKTLEISAKDGSGLLQLQEFLVKLLQEKNILIERLFSYETVNQLQIIRKYGQMLQEDYRENGIYVKALVPKEWYEKVAK